MRGYIAFNIKNSGQKTLQYFWLPNIYFWQQCRRNHSHGLHMARNVFFVWSNIAGHIGCHFTADIASNICSGAFKVNPIFAPFLSGNIFRVPLAQAFHLLGGVVRHRLYNLCQYSLCFTIGREALQPTCASFSNCTISRNFCAN